MPPNTPSRFDKCTALEQNDLRTLEELLHSGQLLLNGRYPYADGASPLNIAAAAGAAGTVKWLLSKGVDPNARGGGTFGWAIVEAAYAGHVAIVDVLLTHEVDLNARRHALYWAAHERKRKVVESLLAAGTPISLPTDKHGWDIKELEKLIKKTGIGQTKPGATCDLSSIKTMIKSFEQRPGTPDSIELLDLAGVKKESKHFGEMGLLGLPIIRIDGGDVIALRPLPGISVKTWPVVFAGHNGESPKTIAPSLRWLVPAWFAGAHERGPAKVEECAALHAFFGGDPETLKADAKAIRAALDATPTFNPTAAAAMRKRLATATAKELEAYLYDRDWYFDRLESERLLPLGEVAARLAALTQQEPAVSLAAAAGHDGYDGRAHAASAAKLGPRQEARAFALLHTAMSYANEYDEEVPRKWVIAAKKLFAEDAALKAVLALA